MIIKSEEIIQVTIMLSVSDMERIQEGQPITISENQQIRDLNEATKIKIKMVS